MNLIDLIHSKLELFRIEQRYTRRRNRRSTFVSEAQYVDGEYIYSPSSSSQSPRHTGTGTQSGDSDTEDLPGKESQKGSRRLSKIGLDRVDWRKGKQEKRQNRLSVREVRWDRSV